ncbi:MAG: GNAT family N-acetyltransferase [Candidatus Riflebacteria bacterium]
MAEKREISIRPQQIKDARDFYRILTTGDFAYFPVNIASIEAEKRFLRKNVAEFKTGRNYNFSVILNQKVIGAVGIMPEGGRPYNAEIGYFIDREYHGQGFALRAVELAIEYVRKELPGINRLQAIIATGNLCSVRVVEKAGFQKEGILIDYLKISNEFHNAYIFSKIIR